MRARSLAATLFILLSCDKPDLSLRDLVVTWSATEQNASITVLREDGGDEDVGDILLEFTAFGFSGEIPNATADVLAQRTTVIRELARSDGNVRVTADLSPGALGNAYDPAHAKQVGVVVHRADGLADQNVNNNHAWACINAEPMGCAFFSAIDYRCVTPEPCGLFSFRPIEQMCAAGPADADVVVRSVNAWEPGPSDSIRLRHVADLLYEDWPHDVGAVSIQEATDIDAVIAMANRASTLYGSGSVRLFEQGGNISPAILTTQENPWRVTAIYVVEIGKDSWRAATLAGRPSRHLYEVLMTHAVRPWTFRFYATHLSHDSANFTQNSERLDQARKIVEIVRNRVQPGELPPIIAGDFNFHPSAQPDVARVMASTFYSVNAAMQPRCAPWMADAIEQVWVGLDSVFPRSSGTWIPITYRQIPLNMTRAFDDYVGILSDHDIPVVTSKVLEK